MLLFKTFVSLALASLLATACNSQREPEAAALAQAVPAKLSTFAPEATFTCLLAFSGEGQRQQVGHLARLTTADADMPDAHFDDAASGVRVDLRSVNYMDLLALTVSVPSLGVEDYGTVDLPAPATEIFRRTYHGAFGTRRAWNPLGDVDFATDTLEVSCAYLL